MLLACQSLEERAQSFFDERNQSVVDHGEPVKAV
jgi:hypothetical protein